MKLIQHTPTKTYEILADYTKISKESPLIAILKVCSEQSPFTVDMLQDFLSPLNKNAVKNIIHRLVKLDYLLTDIDDFDDHYQNEPIGAVAKRIHRIKKLEYDEEVMYSVSERGEEVCLKEEIEEEKRGVLKMTIAYPENAEALMVKLEALQKDAFHNQENIEDNAQSEFSEFINESQHLKNGTFKLKGIEDIYVIGEEKKQDYIFNFSDESYKSELLDFSKTVKVDKSEVISELLANEYESDYDKKAQLIRMPFDANELSLKRKVSIHYPEFDGLHFNKVVLDNPIKISPVNLKKKKKWYKALIVSRIQNYFFSDDEFNVYTNQIAEEFVEYKQKLSKYISREELINDLSQPEDFYKKAKLETINYLNY